MAAGSPHASASRSRSHRSRRTFFSPSASRPGPGREEGCSCSMARSTTTRTPSPWELRERGAGLRNRQPLRTAEYRERRQAGKSGLRRASALSAVCLDFSAISNADPQPDLEFPEFGASIRYRKGHGAAAKRRKLMGKHARSSGHFRHRYPVLAAGAVLAVAGVSSVLVSGGASDTAVLAGGEAPAAASSSASAIYGCAKSGEGSPIFRSPPRRPVRPGNAALPGRCR